MQTSENIGKSYLGRIVLILFILQLSFFFYGISLFSVAVLVAHCIFWFFLYRGFNWARILSVIWLSIVAIFAIVQLLIEPVTVNSFYFVLQIVVIITHVIIVFFLITSESIHEYIDNRP